MSEHAQHRGSRLVAACRLAGGLLVVALGVPVALDWFDPASVAVGIVALLAFALLVVGNVLAGERRHAAGISTVAVGLLCLVVGVARAKPVLRVSGLVLTVAAGTYVVALGVGFDPLAVLTGSR